MDVRLRHVARKASMLGPDNSTNNPIVVVRGPNPLSNGICSKPKFKGKAMLSRGPFTVGEEGTKGRSGTERALLTQKLEKSNVYLNWGAR